MAKATARRPGRVTLRDVARQAGVSDMSVSNVINGRFGSMTKETRARIEGAIAALGYRPHVGALGLRRGRRFSLGLLVVDRSPTYLAEPWMSDLVAGITNHLIDRDYGLFVQGATAETVFNTALLRQVATDGLLVMLSGEDGERKALLKRICATHQPVILFQEVLARLPADVCVLRQEDRWGGRELAALVLAGGARRLVMLTTGWEWPSLKQRELGIRDALAERGLQPGNLSLVQCEDGAFDPTVAALSRHLDDAGLPDAILAGSDPMGLAAMRLLQSRGIRVPRDVAVTGFGAFDASRYADPILTTVRSPAYQLGEQGASVLLQRLETGRFATTEIVLPVELRPAGSTRPVPSSQDTVGKQGGANSSSALPSQR